MIDHRIRVSERLDNAHARLGDVIPKLAALALEDLHGLVMPSGTDVHVSTSRGASTVEAAADRRPVDYERIAARFERAADILEDLYTELTPRATKQRCRTADCKGEGTHAGRCWRCDKYVRKHRAEPPAPLVKDWNSRLPTECGCGTDCCPEGCLDMVPPGQGSISPRCRQRRSRARRE